MFKNKTLDIKIIFKILKMDLKHSRFPNKFLFYKISNNNFKKLFSKIVFQNAYQIDP